MLKELCIKTAIISLTILAFACILINAIANASTLNDKTTDENAQDSCYYAKQQLKQAEKDLKIAQENLDAAIKFRNASIKELIDTIKSGKEELDKLKIELRKKYPGDKAVTRENITDAIKLKKQQGMNRDATDLENYLKQFDNITKTIERAIDLRSSLDRNVDITRKHLEKAKEELRKAKENLDKCVTKCKTTKMSELNIGPNN